MSTHNALSSAFSRRAIHAAFPRRLSLHTLSEAEGHEAEDGEEGGYREAGESVHGAAGGGMMRDSVDHTSARKRGKAVRKRNGQRQRPSVKKQDKFGGAGT